MKLQIIYIYIYMMRQIRESIERVFAYDADVHTMTSTEGRIWLSMLGIARWAGGLLGVWAV